MPTCGYLEEVMSPVTTPTEDVGHRIKHVAGSMQTRHITEATPNGFHLQSVSQLLLVISCALVLLVILNMMLFASCGCYNTPHRPSLPGSVSGSRKSYPSCRQNGPSY